MQPVAIKKPNSPGVEVVDPLDPEVLKLLQRRKPFWLTLPLVWAAPRTIGQQLDSPQTKQRRFDTLVIGCQSQLTYSRVRLKQESGEDFFSTEPIPIGAFSGYIGQYRQPYRWDTFLYIPGNTVIQADAYLGETTPGSGVAEPNGGLYFEAISLV